MGRALFFLLPFCLLLTEAEAIDLTVSGGWSRIIDASDLAGRAAGNNLLDTYESTTQATNITIYNCAGDSDNWRVDIRRWGEGDWPSDFTLFVKRTSDGAGSGSISGDFSYLEITSTDTPFFSGSGDRSNITVQYELTGMSIDISPNYYEVQVILTVEDIP
jgi:hypothetical protein